MYELGVEDISSFLPQSSDPIFLTNYWCRGDPIFHTNYIVIHTYIHTYIRTYVYTYRHTYMLILAGVPTCDEGAGRHQIAA